MPTQLNSSEALNEENEVEEKNFQLTDKRIPITLLTGFLGSGKTTLLNDLVKQPELSTALVIINEFGEVSVDHLLVNHSTENFIVGLSSGCVCCTVRGDLINTLNDVLNEGKIKFSRVFIETTGLADPLPIMHSILHNLEISKNYLLDGIVTTVDFANGNETLNNHPESMRQAGVADCIVLTKEDITEDEERESLIERLEGINPGARMITAVNGKIDAKTLLDFGLYGTSKKGADIDKWLNERAYQFSAPSNRSVFNPTMSGIKMAQSNHNVNIKSFCFSVDEPIPLMRFETWLEILMTLVGPKLLRVKGILNIKGHPLPMVVHGVQNIFHSPAGLDKWPSEDRRSKIVFITQDLDKSILEQTLMNVLFDSKK